jgi:hypothetical protein
MELSEVNEEKDILIVLIGKGNYLQQLKICLFLIVSCSYLFKDL